MQRIRRALAPVLLAAAALACAFVVQRALACPIGPMPQTLRTLYQHSDRVVVARVGASKVLKTEGQVQTVRTALHVREDVKGSGERVVNYYHRELVGGWSGGGENVRISLSGRVAPRYKEGERFLFFLERREGGEGFVVNDDSYGVKALSDEGLKLYLERIRELAAITSREKEDKAAIVEWLVRCAEEPVTRWEGTFELSQSASLLKWENERKAAAEAEAAKKPDGEAEEEVEEEVADEEVDEEASADEEAEETEGEAESEESEEESDGGESETGDDDAETPTPSTDAAAPAQQSPRPTLRGTPADLSLAPLLDGMQKQRLADALFAAQEMGEGENALLNVVKEFGDARFPDFVLMQLRRVEEEPPYEAGIWLNALAELLGDKALVEVANAYGNGTSHQAPPGEDGAYSYQRKEGESEEEHMARFRVAVERATRRRSAALKAALSRVELFLASGAVASK